MNPESDKIQELTYGGELMRDFYVGGDDKGRYHVRQYREGDEIIWRFSHVCLLPRSGKTMRVAPLLQTRVPGGHFIMGTDPLHIEPSILCEDCGLHGFVREGKWVSA